MPWLWRVNQNEKHPEAFDVESEDGCEVYEAVHGGQRHGRIRKDFAPLAKRLVGRDQQGSPFVASADTQQGWLFSFNDDAAAIDTPTETETDHGHSATEIPRQRSKPASVKAMMIMVSTATINAGQ